MTRRWTLLLALLVLAISACTNGGGGGKAGPGETPAGAPPSSAAVGPADLTTALLAIEQGPRYPQSDWGYLVLDQKTGEVLASQSPVRMFDAGLDDEDASPSPPRSSTTATTTCSARPVYRVGHVRAATP